MSKTVNTFFIVGALYMASSNLPQAQAQGVQTPANVVAQRTNTSQNAGSAQRARKKLIQLGWDQPTPADLRAQWQRIENTTPFDGITVVPAFRHAGRDYDENTVLLKEKIPRSALNGALADLKAARFTRMKENFLRINSTPGTLDWFNNADWDAAISNIANIAWLAKESGFRGICFDSESYNDKQYRWKPEAGHSFEASYAMARRRGAQMMRAVVREYPDITFWSLWIFAQNRQNVADGTRAGLPSAQYGLWPAFLNGWLDALPPTARLVEGNEDAYYFQADDRFAEVYNELRNPNGVLLQTLLEPENRVKYQTQVSISFGIYFDAHLDVPDSRFYLGPLGDASRLDRLRNTTRRALDIADEYVWVYNEQVKWWPISSGQWGEGNYYTNSARLRPGGGRLVEEAFPGATEQLRLAKDPLGQARHLLAQGKLSNSARNGSFETQSNAPEMPVPPAAVGSDSPAGSFLRDGQPPLSDVPGFRGRKPGNPQAVVELDAKVGRPAPSAMVRNTGGATLSQRLPVKNGQAFLVQVDCLPQGATTAKLSINWVDAQGAVTMWGDTKVFAAKEDLGAGWKRMGGIVDVPSGATAMLVSLSVADQNTDTDVCWWDNLGVYDLSAPLR